MTYKRKCKVCGKEFEAKYSQIYCSKDCYRIATNESNRNKRKNKPTKMYKKICSVCGKEFETKWNKTKYCSPECKKEAEKEINKKSYYKHREIRVAKVRQYRKDNKEKVRASKNKYKEKNRERISKHNKEYYRKNAEEKKAKVRIYRNKNRDEINRKQRESYHKNIEERRKRSKEDYQKHKETYKLYNDTHKEQRNSRRKFKRETDPAYKMRDWCRISVRRCLKSKSMKTFDILGYTPEELRNHIESLWEPWMSWDNYGCAEGCWTIDHIKPLSAFNFINEDGSINYAIVKEANALYNLRPLEHRKNSHLKRNVWTTEDEEEYQERKPH